MEVKFECCACEDFRAVPHGYFYRRREDGSWTRFDIPFFSRQGCREFIERDRTGAAESCRTDLIAAIERSPLPERMNVKLFQHISDALDEFADGFRCAVLCTNNPRAFRAT